MATIQKSLDGEHWTEVASSVDVSAYHHNHHGGFLALRPALMLTEGVTVKAFGYRAI